MCVYSLFILITLQICSFKPSKLVSLDGLLCCVDEWNKAVDLAILRYLCLV